jgi:hypothetical protein
MEIQNELKAFLSALLSERAEGDSLEWLKNQLDKIREHETPAKFYLAFSQASRYFKKENLNISPEEREKANLIITGFDPSRWDLLQTARTILVLSYSPDKEVWLKSLHQLFETSEVHELQALYAALPLMPYQEELLERAIDGCRTNMSLVFDAIALDNPFPPTCFPETNWNQLVLKAIFMQRPIYRIQKLDERRNKALAQIASDFAHERWAAGRSVMPELWRLMVPFMDEKLLEDLRRVVYSEDPMEAEAGVLAIYQCDYTPGKELLQAFPELVSAIEYGEITWEKIGRDFQEQKA